MYRTLGLGSIAANFKVKGSLGVGLLDNLYLEIQA